MFARRSFRLTEVPCWGLPNWDGLARSVTAHGQGHMGHRIAPPAGDLVGVVLQRVHPEIDAGRVHLHVSVRAATVASP